MIVLFCLGLAGGHAEVPDCDPLQEYQQLLFKYCSHDRVFAECKKDPENSCSKMPQFKKCLKAESVPPCKPVRGYVLDENTLLFKPTGTPEQIAARQALADEYADRNRRERAMQERIDALETKMEIQRKMDEINRQYDRETDLDYISTQQQNENNYLEDRISNLKKRRDRGP